MRAHTIMARYRRRRPYRRRLVRRRPVALRRKFIRRRRQTSFPVKLTRSVHVTANGTTDYNLSFMISLNDFAEHINLAGNFERVKVLRQTVLVLPQQNVANNTTSRIGSYALIPYHKPLPTTPSLNFPTALSIDKAKVFRGTQKGRMSFVPAARIGVEQSGEAGVGYTRTDWRPTLELGREATLPYLYTGFFAHENLGVTGMEYHYTIIQHLYVRYYNQRSFI